MLALRREEETGAREHREGGPACGEGRGTTSPEATQESSVLWTLWSQPHKTHFRLLAPRRGREYISVLLSPKFMVIIVASVGDQSRYLLTPLKPQFHSNSIGSDRMDQRHGLRVSGVVQPGGASQKQHALII